MTFPMPTFMPSAGELATVAQQASGSSTSTTITAPADIIAGDLLVFANRGQNSSTSAPTLVTPSGFTNIFDVADTRARLSLFYKIADGSEASSSLSGMSGTANTTIVLVTFRGSQAIASATPSFSNSGITSGDPTSQTVDVTGLAVPVVVCGYYTSDGTVPTPTFTVGGSDAKDGQLIAAGSGSHELGLAWKAYNTASSDTVTIDQGDGGIRNLLGSGRFLLT